MDKIQDYALAVLQFHGCDEFTYGDPPVPVKKIVEDLKTAYPKGMDFGYSYEEVAQAIKSISKRSYKTMPREGFDFDDWGRWGIIDLNSDTEAELRQAISSGKPFNTGWHGFAKTDYSLAIVRDDRVTVVSCWSAIDDLDDLIDDCLANGEELTDEQFEEIYNDCLSDFWFMTEKTESSQLQGTASFDEVMEEAEKLIDKCNKTLHESYNSCLWAVLGKLYGEDMDKVASLYGERKIKE